MIKDLINKTKNYRKEENGAVIVFVTLCLLPILLMIGLAVDSSHGMAEKRKLQSAADAAAKAGAVNGDGALETTILEATKVFAVNTANLTNVSGPNVSFDPNTQIVTVTASIMVPTTFMQLGGINSNTYDVSASAIRYGGTSEVAIVLDLSTTNANWTTKAINSLQEFVTGLPPSTLVSVTPITTQVSLDPATTNQNALFNHLSNITNDESSNPAFFALSGNYTWNATNFGNTYNYLYGSAFPNSTSYYPLPGTCTGWGGPGTYQACSAFYPALCSTGHTSCRSNYSYTQFNIPSILPLTANRAVISDYLNALANFSTVDSNVFTSLIVWGWRTIAPEWKDFWLVNSDPATTTRKLGDYPQIYNPFNPKSIILVVATPSDFSGSSITSNYKYPCNQGKTNWFMTYYGIFPLTKDKSANLDITCDNYYYQTMDKGLKLNTSQTNYYDPNNSSSNYSTNIATEISAKFIRTCNNIKAQGINIYVITQYDSDLLKNCATSPGSPYYQVSGNGTAHVNLAARTAAASTSGAMALQR